MSCSVLVSAVVSSTFWASSSNAGRCASCFSVRVGTGRVRRSFSAMLRAYQASSLSRSAAEMCITEPWRGVKSPCVLVFCTKVKFFRSLLLQNW